MKNILILLMAVFTTVGIEAHCGGCPTDKVSHGHSHNSEVKQSEAPAKVLKLNRTQKKAIEAATASYKKEKQKLYKKDKKQLRKVLSEEEVETYLNNH